jgi:hypothetical protein
MDSSPARFDKIFALGICFLTTLKIGIPSVIDDYLTKVKL